MIPPVVLTLPPLKCSRAEQPDGLYAGASAVLAHDLVPDESMGSGATLRIPEGRRNDRCGSSDGER